MTNDKLKYELRNYKITENKIKVLELKLKQLESDYINITSPKLDNDVFGTKIGNPTELTALKIYEKKILYSKSLDKEKNKISILNCGLNSLNCLENNVIKLRYIDNRSWGWVAAELHYSERQCRRIGEAAINTMTKVIKD